MQALVAAYKPTEGLSMLKETCLFQSITSKLYKEATALPKGSQRTLFIDMWRRQVVILDITHHPYAAVRQRAAASEHATVTRQHDATGMQAAVSRFAAYLLSHNDCNMHQLIGVVVNRQNGYAVLLWVFVFVLPMLDFVS